MEYYVVVAENDVPLIDGKTDSQGEIVFERYLKNSSLEDCRKFISRLNGRYGKCRIAKLNFIEESNE